MTTAADQNSKTRFLEYRSVVVVGVAHCPATHVFSRLTARLIRSPTVAVRQHLENIVFTWPQLIIYTTHVFHFSYLLECVHKKHPLVFLAQLLQILTNLNENSSQYI